MEDIWTTRDLPVLAAAVKVVDDDPYALVDADTVAPHVKLDRDAIIRALYSLGSGSFFGNFNHGNAGASPYAIGITEQAKRAVGAWPTPESVLERLLADLEAKIRDAPDEETRGKFKRLREWLSSGGQQLLAGSLAQVLGNAGWSAIGG